MSGQPIRSYRDLLVWQEAMTLAELTYTAAAKLPSSERFELSPQLRRAAVSIPSNIAEGYARESKGSYAQFLRISRGSLRELETQLLLAQRLNLLNAGDVDNVIDRCDRVGKLLHGLLRSLPNSSEAP